MMSSLPTAQPDEEPPVNTAGVGAGGGKVSNGATLARSNTSRTQHYANGAGGAGDDRALSSNLSRKPTTGSQVQPSGSPYRGAPPDPDAEPIGPNSETMLKVGSNAYKVDLNKDPQTQGSNLGRPASTPLQNGKPGVGDESDPLARQRDMLLNAAGTGGARRGHQVSQSRDLQRQPTRKGTADSALSPPGGSGGPPSSGPNRDYRNSAEFVVGAYPAPTSPSRSISPNAPTASFMQPPAQATSPIPVENVLSNYEQSLPGERKSVSRPISQQGNYLGHSPHPSQSSNVDRTGRPVSREGHVGIGANGRSVSPQPFQSMPISRSASPALAQQSPSGPPNRNSYIQPPGADGYQAQPPQRATSPNIALDASGKVVMDAMADRYTQQQQQRPPQQPAQQQWSQPPPPQNPTGVQRRASYQPPPQNQPPYAAPAPTAPTGYGPPPGHQQQPQRQPTYGQPQQPPYGAPPSAPYQQQPPPQQQPMYTQPQMTGYAQQQQGLQRGMSVGGGYYNQQGYGHQQQPSQHSTYSYRAPSPAQVHRSPSPQPPPPPQQGPPPTGQYTEDGKPVQFYGAPLFSSSLSVSVQRHCNPVKALYDYQATIEEEFDFQAGDIIAVTATPEDGWWSGELLDEQRRQPGRHVFPSNFVCLF
jgi:hypothetical protein